jgi:Cu(I)/Ag(I) efflux system membrane protein CusA/SilA
MVHDEDRDGQGWIASIVERSARNPFITIVLVGLLAVWGWMSLREAPLDAIPDLSDTQVIIVSEWDGQSPDLIEDQVTYPLSTAMLAAPGVRFVRGQSFFGLSFVYVIFEDDTDLYWARSRVMEYLASASADLPEGVTPKLGPDATGVGWVFQYALRDASGQQDLASLRSLQDWTIRYALQSVPGVAEVASIGGYVKQYELRLDPDKMRAYDVGLQEVQAALKDSNHEAGGRTIEIAGHEHVIRGRGYIENLAQIENTPLRADSSGSALRLGELGEVSLVPAPRRGLAELDGEGETVGGIVVMRYGENALATIDGVKARLAELQDGLPPGVEIVVTYDRSELILAAIDTLKKTLIEEMIVVALVIFVFLLHVRSTLVPILTLPIAVFLAFIPMLQQELTANIMSLGGIAVAIGAMVDASIILVENLHQRLAEADPELRSGKVKRVDVTVSAMQEVAPSVFFSLLIVTVSFLPVFTLEGTEGRLFRPLAFTKTYSMGFGAILAVTLTPALAALLVRGQILREEHNFINRALVGLYSPVVRLVVRHKVTVVGLAVLASALTVPAFLRLESEFMPPLNEGVILYMPTAPPGMSMTEASKVVQQMDRELKAFPEVERVFGKMGRAETATDPAPMGMAETMVVLKPRSQWREGLTWDGLIAEMDAKLQYPGMPNIWWMPIQTRTEMLATGIRSPLGIQVFGDDLAQVESVALSIESAVAQIPGTRSAFAERATGGFYVDIVVKRDVAARYGMRVHDIHEAVLGAVGGQVVSEVIEGRERYPLSVRYAPEFRDDPQALSAVLIRTPQGAHVPLDQLATVEFVSGPPMVRSEAGKLVSFVFVDTERAIAEYVEEAKAVVEAQVDLPPGVRLGWAGQFTYLERAEAKLRVVLPLTLLLVCLLLYWNTRSWIETGIVLLAVPFSLIGAVWLLYLLGYKLSVAVWVGMIALAGLDAETGVVMLLYLRLAHRSAARAGLLETPQQLEDAIVEGAAKRVRPKLMTVMTTMLGLLPILWSSGAGADVMKRIAAPMVGGLVTSFLLELTVYPALFAIWKGPGVGASELREPDSADPPEGEPPAP